MPRSVPLLERVRFRWLPELSGAKRVLILGDGDGRFLARFAAQLSIGRDCITSIRVRGCSTLARERIRKARLSNQPRLTFTQGDALNTALPGCDYDLVVSHFFLDCFDEKELSQLAAHLGPRLAPDVPLGGLRLPRTTGRIPGSRVSLLSSPDVSVFPVYERPSDATLSGLFRAVPPDWALSFQNEQAI